MKLTISIELDQLDEIDQLGPVFAELGRIQNKAKPAHMAVEVDVSAGLTDPDNGEDPEPETPAAPSKPRKPPKRKPVTAKRARKTKAGRKVVQQKPVVELPPDDELQRGRQPHAVDVADEPSPVMGKPPENIPAQVNPEDKIIDEEEKVVRLRDQPPPEDINPNVVFSQLVQKSQQSAIGLLSKYGLTRFSQAEGETLVAMIQDAQLLLSEAG